MHACCIVKVFVLKANTDHDNIIITLYITSYYVAKKSIRTHKITTVPYTWFIWR